MPRVFILLSTFVLALSACMPVTPAPISDGATYSTTASTSSRLATTQVATEANLADPTAAINASGSPDRATAMPSATNSPRKATATPTIEACLKAGGRVEKSEIKTDQLTDPLVYRVYLPPCYDQDKARSYPVLYLIHGQSFNDDQWERLGVPQTADRLIAAGEMAPFIAVMPKDRVWTEPTQDHFGEAVVQTLVPFIDKNYRTVPDRANRAIGGLSRGGAWAVDLGLKNWELFGSIGVHAGFVFHSDVMPVQEWLDAIPQGETPRIYMDVANADRPDIMAGSVWLEGMLTKNGIPHEWHMFIGQHNEEYWSSHVEDYLRFYTQEWGQKTR